MPGLSLRVTGPHVGFSSRPAGRRLTLRLTRPVSRMRLLFAFPSLRVARELIQGVRRHSKTKLQLIVAVSAAHHRVLPKAATVTLRG